MAPRSTILASEIRLDIARSLRDKYAGLPNVTVFNEDVLDVESPSQRGLFATTRLSPTRIIANPPFGAWQTQERRAQLKRRFPNLYVKETYSTILFHCLDFLTPGGILVFLIPDTFLWLNRHELLRKRLFAEFCVAEVVRFPAKLFPGVAFGYSAMSIITVCAQRPSAGSVTRLGYLSNVDEFTRLGKSTIEATSLPAVPQSARLSEVVSMPGATVTTSSSCTLGELAEIRTGFYSGNDRRWLRRANIGVKRSTDYDDVDPALIASSASPPLTGIPGSCHFIPIVRGGAARFIKSTDWYVDWSVTAVSEYRRPGKNPARFQNAQYYFRTGIGVPMVASSQLTASLLEGRLFDQGIVGVFPKNDAMLFYLLGYLNTRRATAFLRAINATANNSANYLKKIPVPLPTSHELERTSKLVKRAILAARSGADVSDFLVLLEDEYSHITSGEIVIGGV
jgi:hypothetical protein